MPVVPQPHTDTDADDADDGDDSDDADDSAAAPSADLQALVDAALADAGVEGASASVDGDVVTLSGSVATEDAVAAAEDAVAGVDGVGSVDNQLTVELAAAPSADLQALVDAALADAGVEGASASVDGDVVTLSGSVATEDAVAAAEDAVAGVDGVGSVDNQLTAADGEAADGEAADGDAADQSADVGANLGDQLGLEPITFDYRSAAITPGGQAILGEVVDYLEANDVAVEIQGHTDTDGAEADNLALSTRRAESVKAYLEQQGIDGLRLTTVGFGESDPKVPEDSAAAKALNRRIEFLIVDSVGS